MSTIIEKPNITNDLQHIENSSPLQSDNISKKYLLEMMYLLSHLAFASVLVVCLKNTGPVFLAIVLSAMLGYISYDEQNIMPIYTLPAIGTVMYLFDLFIVGEPKNVIKKTNIIFTFKTTLWKLPYYGIMSYYVILYATNTLKKN